MARSRSRSSRATEQSTSTSARPRIVFRAPSITESRSKSTSLNTEERKGAPYKNPFFWSVEMRRYDSYLTADDLAAKSLPTFVRDQFAEVWKKKVITPQSAEQRDIESTLLKLGVSNETAVVSTLGNLLIPDPTGLPKPSEYLERSLNCQWDGFGRLEHTNTPKPDHGVGFQKSVFTSEQSMALDHAGIVYEPISNLVFPFFTAEAKAASSNLQEAICQNGNSMFFASKAIVDLCHNADCVDDLENRILGISIAYDHLLTKIYAHYVKKQASGRFHYKTVLFAHSQHYDERVRWAPHHFLIHLYGTWAQEHLEWLKATIDKLCRGPKPAPTLNTIMRYEEGKGKSPKVLKVLQSSPLSAQVSVDDGGMAIDKL